MRISLRALIVEDGQDGLELLAGTLSGNSCDLAYKCVNTAQALVLDRLAPLERALWLGSSSDGEQLMRISLKALIVEDDPNDLELVAGTLRRNGCDLTYECVDTVQGLNNALEAQPWDVILCDYALPGFNGLEVLGITRNTYGLDVPFIFVSGAVGEEKAAELMRAGAQDFVLKNKLTRLAPAIKRELRAAGERRLKRQIEEKLRAEQSLLKQLVECMPYAIYFKDRSGQFVHINHAERLLLNVTGETEVIGRTEEDFLSPEQARAHSKEDEAVFARGEPLIEHVEKRVQANGQAQWLTITKAPIRDRGGDIIGLIGITRDVTERHRQEQFKDELISTVSHELRTPLTAIAGSLALLAGGAVAALPEAAMHLLKIANNNCLRLVRLVNDILDSHQLETGKMAFNLKPLDVRALIEQTIEANQAVAGIHGVSLRLDDAAANGVVFADPDRLTQVVTNLLSNAIKFSPDGAEVTVMIENRGASIAISVRDRGPGIPGEYKDYVFDRFVQVDATDARSRGGSGLGLAIVKQIVEALHGEVFVEDAPGGGAIFHVVLPASEQGEGAGIDGTPPEKVPNAA